MKMEPIYSLSGHLLGHVNTDECVQTRDSVVVTDLSLSLNYLPSFDDSKPANETVRQFHVPFRTIRFRCESKTQERRCLVVDNLPEWFWEAYPTVKFSSDQWER